MKILKLFSITVLMLAILVFAPVSTPARIMMNAMVNDFLFEALPTATFTVDDWLSNPNLWNLMIQSDKDVQRMRVDVHISSEQFDPIINATVTVVGPGGFAEWETLPAGEVAVINNTMVQEGNAQVSNGDMSDDFIDKVLEFGYLPEGWYAITFSVRDGRYLDGVFFSDIDLIENTFEFEIKNPLPPELMTPDEGANDVVAIPRFTWQEPDVSNLTLVSAGIEIFYTIKLWKMFEENGTAISEEDAIIRIPIWSVENISGEAIDFDPGESREELMVGKKYCWQVQAFDGIGRPITETNEGKSDVWDFTVQFQGPELGEPILTSFTVSWSPALAGGAMVYYRVRIADNPEFTFAYEQTGITLTTFIYPNDAPPLRRGMTYYFEVQTTDEVNILIGDPDQISFELPPVEVNLVSLDDQVVSPSVMPVFKWSGTSDYYMVTLYDEESDWTYASISIPETRWIYDGIPLRRGGTYLWNVTPTNQYGERIGQNSESWRFTIPLENQMALASPIDENIDTVFPIFSWDEVSAVAEVTYNLSIFDNDGTLIHSDQVAANQYTYPRDAEGLRYAARYTWSVNAESDDVELASESPQAWFATPFTTIAGETISMEDIGNAIMIVMRDYPEFSEFENKILQSIGDESGTIAPEQFMRIIEEFNIVRVAVE